MKGITRCQCGERLRWRFLFLAYFVKVLTNLAFSYIMKKIVREKIQSRSEGELDGETKLQGKSKDQSGARCVPASRKWVS